MAGPDRWKMAPVGGEQGGDQTPLGGRHEARVDKPEPGRLILPDQVGHPGQVLIG